MTPTYSRLPALRRSLIGALLATSAGAALAVLGQGPGGDLPTSSVTPALVHRLAAAPLAQAQAYTTQAFTYENGTRVVEYISSTGQVFALSWRGPVLPDLSVMLGDYFKTFQTQTQQMRLQGRRGSAVNIERDGLVISSHGRMRNFSGFAYAPALIPPGVNIKDVLQ